MEFSKDIYCNGCKSFKLSFEFTSYEIKGIKQFKTCNNCCQRFEKRQKSLVEIKNCQTDNLEIIDIDFLSEIIINFLEDISSNNQELHLYCRISNTSFTNEISTKEIADKIIELFEDTDGYHWNFNHLYEGKNITYWYFYSQRNILASKPRKNPDPSK